MTLARDAQQQDLATAVNLEEWMERMSCSTSCWHSTSCQHFSSHYCSASHRRSQSLRWWEEGSHAYPGPWGYWGQTRKSPGKLTLKGKGRYWFLPTLKDILGNLIPRGCCSRTTWSPSPTRQRCQVTFAKGRAPWPGESPRHRAREYLCDTGAEMGYQLPPPT